jgi:hypothetical protein
VANSLAFGTDATFVRWGDIITALEGAADYTIQYAMKSSNTDSNRYLLTKMQNGGGDPGMQIYSNVSDRQHVNHNWGTQNANRGAQDNDGNWQYTAWVFDNVADTVTPYTAADGAGSMTARTATGSFADPGANSANLYFGTANFFEGTDGIENSRLAYVRIWSRKLTTTELDDTFDQHITGDGSSEGLSGLVFNWDAEFESTSLVTAASIINQVTTTAAAAVSGTLTRQADAPSGMGTYSSGSALVTPTTAALTLTTFAPTIVRTGGTETRPVSASSDDAQQIGTTMTLNGTTIGGSLDATTDWAAMRFLNLDIPKGADTTNVVLQVVPSGTGEDEPLVTIYFEDADNPGTFTTTASDISNRARTAGVAWSSTNLGADGATYFDTPDLSAILQAVINRAGWAAGNAVAAIIQGGATTTRDLTIEAYDLGPGTNPPRLVVTWRLIQPAPATLGLTGFAPTVTVAGANVTVTPTTASLTLAIFAPTVTATSHQLVTPTTLALTLATFAPVIKIAVVPGVASLTLTTFAPTVTATQHQLVTPAAASLTLTTFVPVIALRVTPSTAALTLATFAPTVTASNHQSVTPATATLSLATFAPTVSVSNNQIVTPTTAILSLTTFASTVSATAHQTATPSTASLTLTTFAPTVTGGAGLTVTPTTATLTLTTFAPTVTATAHVSVTPATVSLTLSTFAPTVTGGAGVTVVPSTATLTLTAFAPTVTTPQTVTPTTLALVLATFAPTVSTPRLVTPTTAALVLTTFAPSVTATAHVVATPAVAVLVLTTFAPTVTATGQAGDITISLVATLGGTTGLSATVGGTSAVGATIGGTLALSATLGGY